jgi:hypothetical protein
VPRKGDRGMKSHLILSGLAVVALALLISCTSPPTPPSSPPPPIPGAHSLVATEVSSSSDAISGIVLDPQGLPLSGATVRIQATENQTLTDNEGRFVLRGLKVGQALIVSAWKAGYYCANAERVTPPGNITLNMRLVQTNDNPNYQWIPPTGPNSCYSCKPSVTRVWLDNDAHGTSAANLRFLTMYNGTDINGNQSPMTQYGYSRDYGRVSLLPDLTKPYYGPGYKLDFPDAAGNCAACHVPGAAVDAPYDTNPNTVSGVNKFGVHCDYCHKVADVKLDPASGLPYPNMPGVLSQDIRRPFPEDRDRYSVFFGTFDDDNVPMEDTYLPLIKESAWCAPCHFGKFWDTTIYNSYGEWLASPYSSPQSGKTCQQCHVPAPTILNGEPITNVAPEKGGIARDPLTIHAHTFPGASNAELLQNAVTMTASAQREGAQLVVEVRVVNDKTGHDVPTDSPLRQMILLVQASDPAGKSLRQTGGESVPRWGGVGDPAEGYYAGLPGKVFAKILMELWTEATPTGAYWNPTRIASDNRIAAFESDASTYTFAFPAGGSADIKVTLLFRRAFKELMDRKGWDVPDIVMAQQALVVK